MFFRLTQGRSQDFSVGTHSFPSHLFTPPPPPKKKDQSHFRFTCLLFQIYKYKYIWNIFFNLFFYFIYLFIYFFIIIFRYAIAYLRTGSYAPVTLTQCSVIRNVNTEIDWSTYLFEQGGVVNPPGQLKRFILASLTTICHWNPRLSRTNWKLWMFRKKHYFQTNIKRFTIHPFHFLC